MTPPWPGATHTVGSWKGSASDNAVTVVRGA
jgi:hypothetical protein